MKSQAQQELQTHIQETIPFEYQKSKQAITDLIRRTNEILDANDDDPRIQLSIINTLSNLWAVNMNLNSEGNIIQQAYDKVQTLEEIQRRNREEAVFSEEDIKPEQKPNPKPKPKPDPSKITTIDEQDTAPEPEESEVEETEEE